MKTIKNQERAIKEIIKNYGEIINLKKSPYLIAEIIRNYAIVFNPSGPVSDAPEPGTPPVPGSLPELNPREVSTEEIVKISSELKKLGKKIDALSNE